MKPVVENRVAALRRSRGVGAAELARRTGVSRQTIYAIEAGTYVPNTEVALRLAHELEVAVDELFRLRAGTPAAPEPLQAEVLSAAAAEAGQPVRICRVGERWVSVPVTAAPYYMPEADGVIERPAGRGGARLLVFAKDEAAQKRLVVAGCDPATGLLARMVEKACGVEIVTAAASSKLALRWLKQGKVHIAGSHLEDAKTGEFNLPFLRREFAGEDLSVITFARWEEGLVVAAGNPKRDRAGGGPGAPRRALHQSRDRLRGARAAGPAAGAVRHRGGPGERLRARGVRPPGGGLRGGVASGGRVPGHAVGGARVLTRLRAPAQ